MNGGMPLRSLPRAARLEWTSSITSTAKHWKRLREAFMRCIAERDFIGCLIVQEIMLESFAVASYSRVGKVAPGSLGQDLCAHRGRGRRARRSRHGRFSERSAPRTRSASTTSCYRLHLEVMTTLAKMLAKECKDGHCEVCHSSCVKPSLFEVNLSAAAASRSVAATVSEDAGHAGLTRGGHTRMGAQLPV